MTHPTDDENELNSSMSAREMDSEEEIARRKKKDDSGEGDQDSFGRGKAGAGAGGGIKLPPQKLKEIMADWRHLTAQDLMDAVVEFFSEGPMRASANVVVSWTNKTNAKAFALVNWVIDFGAKAVAELNRTRERVRGAGRDSRGFQQRQKPLAKLGMNATPTGPTK